MSVGVTRAPGNSDRVKLVEVGADLVFGHVHLHVSRSSNAGVYALAAMKMLNGEGSAPRPPRIHPQGPNARKAVVIRSENRWFLVRRKLLVVAIVLPTGELD